MYARALRRRTQLLFGCLGMKNYPLFFSRARRGASSNTKGAYRVLISMRSKNQTEKVSLRVFLSRKVPFSLRKQKRAFGFRSFVVRESVNYIIKVTTCRGIFAIFFSLRAREFRVCNPKKKPAKFREERRQERERERRSF
jgi:hypothetical protein